ncbi:hypothetical protein [Promicromonospora kroppenstedtii]|uniref:hypothetical protein n=1 Tax=Promicromonospora kroppenstedtii TaxID=440482 RepID=UPI0004AD69BA|nr:hypothetical protein [Promicromonospora kroppenstedtii]
MHEAQEGPDRTGRPWTDEETARIVAQVRDGADERTVTARARRSSGSVVSRLRRMLPLEHRSCPVDMVVPALRDHLRDPDYDWRAAMLLTPPPRPVVRPPEIVRTGVAGLADDDLVGIAHSVLLDDRAATADLRERLVGEVRERGLGRDVVATHESYLATLREPAGIRDVDEWVRRWSTAVGLGADRYAAYTRYEPWE